PHDRPVRFGQPAVAARHTAPLESAPVGVIPFVPVPGTAIASELAVDGASVPPQQSGDGGDRQLIAHQLAELVPFLLGDLLIRHRLRSLGRRSEVYTGAAGRPSCCT